MLTIHRNRTRQFMDNLLSDLVEEPSGELDNCVRMSSSDFEYILQKISPIIAKKDTYWREAIPPKIRLALTLRFLATGDSYRSLHYHFKISSTLISRIIPEVCLALNQVLKDMIKAVLTADYDRNGELIHVGMRVNHEENLLPLKSVPRRAPINATQIRSNFMNYIHQSRLCSGRAYDA
ncbi:unnamed protein product [Pieris macdunnoughi]|uniref:Protein ANTAGONIST OF LIKE HETEROCHROMATIN PROTEIN 1-like n=1 Tax=Pieris macdunnoughi TaxID=345717 RepID=A0A821YG91_9NEOP|nr:unnamed protein product [Pieris macdunnoughi]